MRKKDQLTALEHQEVGAKLKVVHDELNHLWVLLANKYPLTTPFVRQLDNALRYVKKAKCELDTTAGNEHPNEFNTRWYYGPAHDSREVRIRPQQELKGNGS